MAAAAAVTRRGPSAYNKFVRMFCAEEKDNIATHKERFAAAAAAWKALEGDDRVEAIAKAEKFAEEHPQEPKPAKKAKEGAPKKSSSDEEEASKKKGKGKKSSSDEEEEEAPKKKGKGKKSSSDEEEEKKPKKTRAPTMYNRYMSMRIKELKTEFADLTFRERFSMAATSWKELSPEEKEEVVSRLKAEMEASA
jgi:hypothetical protein